MPGFGKKSLEQRATLVPELQRVVDFAIRFVDFSITEGRRTLERQKQLLAEGKTKTLDSKHLTGEAFDFAPYPELDWKDRERFIYIAGHIMMAGHTLGVPLRYGGDWDRDGQLKDNVFDDLPHFELHK